MNGINELFEACKVIMLDKKISAWLSKNDPQALEQVQKAVTKYQYSLIEGGEK